ncbi:MAG TPA: alpha-amylase family protein [Burkholderiaceae bacterium]
MKRLAARCALTLALAATLAACGGGGGTTGSALLPPLDPTYRASGRAAAGEVFVHLFEWRWSDIARECETFLGPAGYAAVQISPPSEHAVITSGVGYPWWQRYQTVSYRLDQSRSGTLAEFRDMVSRCNTAGVKIYADAVINHMTAGAGTGSAGSTYSKTDYPAVSWGTGDFHAGCSVGNYADAANVQLCELVGLADLRTEDDAVRSKIAAYLIALHAEGVAGFRIDAAKHMQPRDIDAIVSQVNSAALAAGRPLPYYFLEVINNAGEAVTAEQYFGVGYAAGGAADITDFHYGYRITDAFTGRNGATLASLQTLTSSLLPTNKGVVFIDNHDNQRGDNLYYVSTVGGVPVYDLAAIFMLAHPHGAPSVMSSYGFDRSTQSGRDAGPPSSPPGVTQSTYDGQGNTRCTATIGSVQVGSWICEHRLVAIANMVAFRKATAGAPLAGLRTINADNNRIAFARDGKGFVALSRSVAATFSAATTLPDGNYCNVARFTYQPASGGAGASCSGAPVSVAGGSALIDLPANGAVVLHVGAKL